MGTTPTQKVVDYSSEDKYRGQIIRGMPYGEGTLRNKNGDLYVGHFLKGMRHGKGIQIWENGDNYDGWWELGVINKIGKFTSGDRKEMYEGD